MAPAFLFPLASAAAECGGRGGCGAPFQFFPAAVATAFTQSLMHEVPAAMHHELDNEVHFDSGHAGESAHHHHVTEFFAKGTGHEVDHTAFFDSPTQAIETIPSTLGASTSSDSAVHHDATSFLASGAAELSPEELAMRSTQLRVAFGISGATMTGSLGIAAAFVIKLARKHLADQESDEEEVESDDEADQHEADLSAGQRSAGLVPDRARISIHNQTSKASEIKPAEVVGVQTNEEVTAYY